MRTRYRTPAQSRTNASVNSRNLYQRIPSSEASRTSPGAAATRTGSTLNSARLSERYRPQLQANTSSVARANPGAGTLRPRGERASPMGTGQPRAVSRTTTASSAARSIRGTASNHYARPGSESPILSRTTATRGRSEGAATLSSGSLARAGTTTVARAPIPRLTNTLRSGVGSGAIEESGYYGSGYYGSGYYGGGHYGSGWNAGLSFSFGIGWGGGWGVGVGVGYGYGWGFYGYPYYWGCYWPYYRSSYYYRPYYWGYGSRWPGYGRLWSPYVSAYNPVYYGGVYDTYPSTIVVREETRTDVPEEEAVATGAETLASLADRFVALGDFYFRENRFAESAEAYARARTYAPDDATIHFVLSDSLFAIGDYHFAAFLISEALRLEPDLARAEADKRTFYSDPSVFDGQMDTLAKYLADKPYDAAAHLVNGYNLRFSGRTEEAKIAFQRVMEIEPGNQAAKAFLDALESPEEEIRD